MKHKRRAEAKKKYPGIPLFLVPRVIREQVKRKRAKLSRIHVVRERGSRFTVAVVWLPKKQESRRKKNEPVEGTGDV